MSLSQSSRSSEKAYIGRSEATPLGLIWLAVSEKGLVAVKMGGNRSGFASYLERLGFQELIDSPERVSAAVLQLNEYLDGQRSTFDLPIDWDRLAPFHRHVLEATFAIPYGSTATYSAVAQKVGRPRAARAVGRAEATNPMPLIIPCHRVIGSDGKLHGYGGLGGLQTKAWLLKLEEEHNSNRSNE